MQNHVKVQCNTQKRPTESRGAQGPYTASPLDGQLGGAVTLGYVPKRAIQKIPVILKRMLLTDARLTSATTR
jgi:hypothetical protein